MNICVTGAAGFLGRALSLKLLQAGHDLTIVTRSSKDLYEPFPFPCTAVEWKGGEDPFPDEALQKSQGIIHLLGESIAEKRWSKKKRS